MHKQQINSHCSARCRNGQQNHPHPQQALSHPLLLLVCWSVFILYLREFWIMHKPTLQSRRPDYLLDGGGRHTAERVSPLCQSEFKLCNNEQTPRFVWKCIANGTQTRCSVHLYGTYRWTWHFYERIAVLKQLPQIMHQYQSQIFSILYCLLTKLKLILHDWWSSCAWGGHSALSSFSWVKMMQNNIHSKCFFIEIIEENHKWLIHVWFFVWLNIL